MSLALPASGPLAPGAKGPGPAEYLSVAKGGPPVPTHAYWAKTIMMGFILKGSFLQRRDWLLIEGAGVSERDRFNPLSRLKQKAGSVPTTERRDGYFLYDDKLKCSGESRQTNAEVEPLLCFDLVELGCCIIDRRTGKTCRGVVFILGPRGLFTAATEE